MIQVAEKSRVSIAGEILRIANRIYEAGVGVKRKVRRLCPGRQARVGAGDKLGDSSFVVTI
jgi:hypothetical protein